MPATRYLLRFLRAQVAALSLGGWLSMLFMVIIGLLLVAVVFPLASGHGLSAVCEDLEYVLEILIIPCGMPVLPFFRNGRIHHFEELALIVSGSEVNAFLWGYTLAAAWRGLRSVLSVVPTPAKRRARRLAQGLCVSCGYDLRGNPAATTCPECGAAIQRDGCAEKQGAK